MKAKSEKRLEAERLRTEQGLSYSEIAEQVGVSKSTLSYWLKQITLTYEQEIRIQQHIEDNQSSFVAQAREINKKRFQEARNQAFQTGTEIAQQIPDDDRIHELALAMLYLGEGDKTGNRIQIANTDPSVLRYFLWAMEKLYKIDRVEMSLRLNLIEIARPLESQMIDWWSSELTCMPTQFSKTQFDSRSKSTNITGEYHGVCTITYNDTYLYERLKGLYTAYFNQK